MSDAVVAVAEEAEPADTPGPGRSRWRQRERQLVATFGPAVLIFGAQQILFPMKSGLVVRGLILGALTALIALGMGLVYRANRIVNFAQGDLGYVPTILVFLLMTESGMPYGVAVAVGLVVAVLLGAATERLVIRRFFRAPRLLATVATIGLSRLLVGAALLLPKLWDQVLIGGEITPPFEADARIGGVVFTTNDLLAAVAAPILIVVVAAFLQRSEVGVAIRASADSPDRAALLGIPVFRLQTLVWTVASVLAFVTMFLSSGILGIPQAGTTLGLAVLLRALVALLLGRMTNLVAVTTSAVALGALDQGVVVNHGDRYAAPVLGLVVLIAVVVRRRELSRRPDVLEEEAWQATPEVRPVPAALARLPAVRAVRWLAVATVAVVAAGLPVVLDTGQLFEAGALLCFALLGLSLVLLSGWGGIVSLGHIAYFAVGAAVAGWLIVDADVDLFVALLAVAVLGAAVATLVGAPAMRMRGLYLVVTSFAFALATAGYLLDRSTFDWIPRDEDRIVAPILGGLKVDTDGGHYYVVLVVLTLVALGLRGIRTSRFGRALVALRDNDRAAQAYAVDPAWIQLTAFALSGAVAALAGGLFAYQQRTYDSGSFGAQENLAVFIMVVIGGMTSITGAVAGALYLFGAQWLLPNEWQAVAQGVGVIAVLLAFPGGLASVVFGARDRLLRRVATRRSLDVSGYTRRRRAADPAPSPIDSLPPPRPTGTGPLPPPPSGVRTAALAGLTNAGTGGGPVGLPPPRAQDRRDGDVLLGLRGVEVGYGGVPVLFGVDMDVMQGEAVVLLGTNGAGKSTLLRSASGLIAPTAGEVVFAGERVTGRPAHQVAARGVHHMPGGHGVFPTLTVRENLRAATWLQRRDRAEVELGLRRVERLFPVLAQSSHEKAANLSGGQQQMLALAMALLGRPRLLMIDELSLGLAPAVVGDLLRFVDHLRAGGTTLLVVEQSVNVALEIADRAVFLERGQVRFSGPARDLLDRPDLLRSVFLGAATTPELPVASTDPRRPASPASSASPASPVALAVVDLAASFDGVRAVDGVSFEVASGEIVGVVGPNGAGKTTLFDLVSGFVPPAGGRVVVAGREVTHRRASARARLGLGRSFQDARLFGSLTVDEAIAVALERWVTAGDPLSAAFHLPNADDSERRVRRRVADLVELLGLGPYRSLFVHELSTGTRRVVDLACLLAHRPRVVLLDEPAAGIAQREVEQLAPLIRRIRDDLGASIVVVEHDIPLVEEVADRLVAMDRGRVLAIGPPAEVLADPAVMRSYLGENGAAIPRSSPRAPDRKEAARATDP